MTLWADVPQNARTYGYDSWWKTPRKDGRPRCVTAVADWQAETWHRCPRADRFDGFCGVHAPRQLRTIGDAYHREKRREAGYRGRLRAPRDSPEWFYWRERFS